MLLKYHYVIDDNIINYTFIMWHTQFENTEKCLRGGCVMYIPGHFSVFSNQVCHMMNVIDYIVIDYIMILQKHVHHSDTCGTSTHKVIQSPM